MPEIRATSAASWGSRDSGDQGWGQCTQRGQTRAFLTELPSRASAPGRWAGAGGVGGGLVGTGTTSELESAPGAVPGVRAQHPPPSPTATAAPLAPRPSKEEVRTVALSPHLISLGPQPPPPSPSPFQPSYALILPICPALNLPSDPSPPADALSGRGDHRSADAGPGEARPLPGSPPQR